MDLTLTLIVVVGALVNGFWYLLWAMLMGCALKRLVHFYNCKNLALAEFAKWVGWGVQLGTCLYVTISYPFLGYPAYSIFYPLMVPVLFAAQFAAVIIYNRRIKADLTTRELLVRTLLAEAAATAANMLLALHFLPQVIYCY